MLILRPFHPDNWPVLAQYQYPEMSEAEIKALISEFNSGSYNGRRFQMLAAENDGILVGSVSLFEQEPGIASEGVEIYPPYRRQGYAYAALKLLWEQSQGYHTITAQIRKDNTASLALHRKLGFEIVNEFVNRRGHPVYSLSLTLRQGFATLEKKMGYYIRTASVSDADAICQLNRTAMGYDYPITDTAKKLDAVLNNPRNKIFVAVADNLVVGYIHANMYDVLYDPTMTNIMGLAVSVEYRRSGIGKALICAVEEWAKSNGSYAIRLNSGGSRKEAHCFYRHCGFSNEKEQLRFLKEL